MITNQKVSLIPSQKSHFQHFLFRPAISFVLIGLSALCSIPVDISKANENDSPFLKRSPNTELASRKWEPQQEPNQDWYPKEKDVLASVGNRSFYLKDVRFFLRGVKGNSISQQTILDSFFSFNKNQVPATSGGKTERQKSSDSNKKIPLPIIRQVVKQLVKKAVLLEYLRQKEKLIDKSEINTEILRLEKTLGKESFQLLLKQRQCSREQLVQEMLFLKSWTNFEKRTLNDKNLQTIFKKNAARFDGTVLKVAHILWNRKRFQPDNYSQKKSEFEKIQKQIADGELDFSEAAKKHSDGSSKNEGGVLGWIAISGPMTPQFSHAAFRLKDGQISEVVISPHGLHIIKVIERKKGKHLFEDVKGKVYQFARNELVHQVVDKMGTKAKINYSNRLFKGNLPL